MNQRGATAVEFAIVLPVLLLLIFGIIEFSVLLYNKAMITNAAREGARYGSLYNWPSPASAGQIQARAGDHLSGRLISFGGDPEGFIVGAQFQDMDGDGISNRSGDILAVSVSYTHDFLVLPSFAAGMAGVLDLYAESAMRVE